MHSDPQRPVGDLNCRGRLSSSNLDERILWSHPGTGRCAGDSECAERRGGGGIAAARGGKLVQLIAPGDA